MANSTSNDGRNERTLHRNETEKDAPSEHADLPPPGATRWVIRRKAAVLSAIDDGALSITEACNRYGLSAEEINAWRKLITAHGLRGLRSTRLQQYRKTNAS